MTEQKHTRGPWIFDTNNDAITTEERKRTSKTRIATVELGWAEPFESEQFANACLITAAPDLLEALSGMLACWRSVCRAQGWEPEHVVEAIRAHEAIAKATGGSND